MKKLMPCMALLVVAAGALLADQWSGWLTDQKCAAAGKFAGEQHKKCVEAGQPVVFVNDADKKIYKVNDNDMERVKALVGQKVNLTGTAKQDTIEVKAVTVASQ